MISSRELVLTMFLFVGAAHAKLDSSKAFNCKDTSGALVQLSAPGKTGARTLVIGQKKLDLSVCKDSGANDMSFGNSGSELGCFDSMYSATVKLLIVLESGGIEGMEGDFKYESLNSKFPLVRGKCSNSR